MRKTTLAAALMTAVALMGCDVKKTQEGNVTPPKYEVEKQQSGDVTAPKYEVTTPDVKVGTTEKTVTIPKITITTEEKQVRVPTIEVQTGKEKEQQKETPKQGN